MKRNIIPVVHLNGLVGQSGQRAGQLVFSEEDFALFGDTFDGHDQEQYLEDRFAKTTTVFVGTSLRDIHLVRSLVRSRDGLDRRFAIMPAQQFYSSGVDFRIVDHLADTFSLRLRHLGVRAIVPDFFGQVSQLLNELAHRVADPDRYQGYEYHTRLRLWWREWNQYDSASTFDDRQRYHQVRLSNCIEAMQLDGLVAEGVQARIELWIRSNPDDRQLELWSNSECVTVRHGTGHIAKIALDSNYPDPVGTFIARQATSGRPERTASRWQWQISSPVVLPDDWLELPVGVVRVLLRHPLADHVGSISDTAIAARAVDVARELLTP